MISDWVVIVPAGKVTEATSLVDAAATDVCKVLKFKYPYPGVPEYVFNPFLLLLGEFPNCLYK